jgi:hypothetical protein
MVIKIPPLQQQNIHHADKKAPTKKSSRYLPKARTRSREVYDNVGSMEKAPLIIEIF